MRSKKAIEEAIRTELNHTLDLPLRDQLLAHALREQGQSQETEPAFNRSVIRRMIMKNSIVKLGIAAVVVAVVGLGIAEFLGTGSTSGTLWAQVAKNVEASRGVIFRARDTGSRDPNDAWPNGYEIRWRSPAISRTDKYRGGQMYRTYYFNYDAKTAIALNHNPKHCYQEALSDERAQRLRAEGWTDPQGLINLALSVEHRALGQKTIDGVLCEGIEVTGPDGSTGRLWVGVETGYPVLVEMEGPGGRSGTMDQFRWNVDLMAEGVEPVIADDDSK
ncbi:MAG: hypothetical protein KBE65_22515 [Phycisphaerae bacterium]|nr:hypothetical protein [Phycisphaerae bacterium]